MTVYELVDELYRAFADKLGEPLASRARDLLRSLKVAPDPRIPWSRVFAHEVTLGAPALIAQAMPRVSGVLVRDAVLAHLLAVIDSFGVDRIENERLTPSASLLAILGHARRERDEAMARVCGGAVPRDLDFAAANSLAIRTIRRERSFLISARPTDFESYERALLDKQCAGWRASVAFARAAGADERWCRSVRATLESVALALQTYEDVVDWEDDLERNGSWAVSLMKGMRPPPAPRDLRPEGGRVRAQVLRTGVLRTMLERAMHHVCIARRRATALGAQRLAAWAASRERSLQALVSAEGRSAGYAVRAHALAGWAGEVLA
jgi:hypothetical protein